MKKAINTFYSMQDALDAMELQNVRDEIAGLDIPDADYDAIEELVELEPSCFIALLNAMQADWLEDYREYELEDLYLAVLDEIQD